MGDTSPADGATPGERAERLAQAASRGASPEELRRLAEREFKESLEAERRRLLEALGVGVTRPRRKSPASGTRPPRDLVGRFEEFLRDRAEAVLIHDMEGLFLAANARASEMLGYEPEELVGMTMCDVTVDFNPEYYELLLHQLEKAPRAMQGLYRARGGRSVPVDLVTSLIELDGRTLVMDVFTDRSHETYRDAYHDELTGLANRALASDRIDVCLNRARRDGAAAGAVIYLDLDHFKNVNDALGHDAGDELLIEVARRISSHVRPHDTCARLGGDEFVLLLDRVGEAADAERVAERVREDLSRGFRVGDTDLDVTGSLGVALCTPEHGEAASVLKKADAAMYRAKDSGRDRVEVD